MLLLDVLGAALLCAAPHPAALTPTAPQEPVQGPEAKPQIPADGQPPVTTASGLTYSVLTAGPADGESPRHGDMVTVHYTGYLTDATIFDDSRVERFPGAGVIPAEFRVGRVIPGWNEALEMMRPGDRWKLTIPPGLAYGDTARGEIPANSTLIFDVELLSFERGPELPDLRRVAEATTTASGLRYEVLRAAERPGATGDALVKLDFAFSGPSGKVIDCMAWADSPMRFPASRPPRGLEFIGELLPQLGAGAELLVEVPPTLFGQGSLPGVGEGEPTIWRLRTLYVAYPPELPPFARPAEGSRVLPESGATVQVLAPGEGEPMGTAQEFELSYTYWKSDGSLVDTTRNPGRGPAPTNAERLRIPFLQELIPELPVGARCLVEAPVASTFGGNPPPGVAADDNVVWLIEIGPRVMPLPVPAFTQPDPEQSTVTESGLVIQVLRRGDGPLPRRDQTARVHYAGWLASDGTLFDNSYERGRPSEFGITQVIDGWTETLLTMPVGTEVLVRIPWALAYGEDGKPPRIPAQADLVFRVHLIDALE